MKIKNGLLDIACQRPSPNFDERPEGAEVELVVIHGISLPPNQFGGSEIEDFFCNQLKTAQHPYFMEIEDLKVSSHLLIKRDGAVVQFVPFHQRAWHAGLSSYQGRENCNDFSVGIEMEGSDDTRYCDVQYANLNQILEVMFNKFSKLSNESVVGHCHISPGRKTDPGPLFDWGKLVHRSNKR